MPRRLTRFIPVTVLFGVLLISGLFSPAAADTKLHVKDGDSFVFGTQEIRLWGIDAVELHQFCWKSGRDYPCGQQAREHLVNLIDPDELRCEEKPRALAALSFKYRVPLRSGRPEEPFQFLPDRTKFIKGL